MYIKSVLTHNSLYVIDEEAETITRAPIDGKDLQLDRTPISFLSYRAIVGMPLEIIHIREDGSIFHRSTSLILTIGTITE